MPSQLFPSLSVHMAQLSLSITYGFPQEARQVYLVIAEADIKAAQAFLQENKSVIQVVGLSTYDAQGNACTSKASYNFYGNTVPVLPLQSIASFPEAKVVLFSSSFFTIPVKLDNGFIIAEKLQKIVPNFSIVPALEKNAWHTRCASDFYQQHSNALEATYALLVDAASQEAFARVVKMLMTGELGYLQLAPFRQYAHPATMVRSGDYVIDGGMHTLIDTQQFAEAAGSSGCVLGFEPEPRLYNAIEKNLETLPEHLNIKIFQAGIGAKKSIGHITDNDAGSWCSRKAGEHTSICQLVDLDSFVLEQHIERIDVIKFDIEGCECDGLRGAENIIRRDKPRLMISAYHNLTDIFTIPDILRCFVPEYRFYFASHHFFAGEFLFYVTL